MKYLLTLIYIGLTTGGIFCLKSGGDSLMLSLKNGLSFKIGYVTMIGFFLYLCSFLLWQKLLSTYDLSYIVPVTAGVIQVIVLLLSSFYFKENISIINIIGTFLVIVGIVFISIKK